MVGHTQTLDHHHPPRPVIQSALAEAVEGLLGRWKKAAAHRALAGARLLYRGFKGCIGLARLAAR
jgi:hypothetical protein